MIKKIFTSYKNSLFEVDNKNLTTGSKASLFIFILIVFIIISSGIQMQKGYVAYPTTSFDYACTSKIDKNREINKFQSRDVSKDIYNSNFDYRYWSLEDFKYDHHHKSESQVLRSFGKDARCQKMGTLYLDVANDALYKDKLIEYKALKNNITKINSQIQTAEVQYASMLLEDIAQQDRNRSILSSSSSKVKEKIRLLNDQLQHLEQRLDEIDNVGTLDSFQSFKNYLDKNSEEIERAYKEAIKYYKFQYTLNVFLFLLPIWFIFYFVYRLFKRKKYHILAHMSLHVANVSAVFIVFYLLSLIYDVIPKVFLSKLIALLSQYNLSVLLNLVAILFFMSLFGFFIYRIQKNRSREFHEDSSQRDAVLKKERILKGVCSYCGKVPRAEDKFCGGCAQALSKECQQCHNTTQVDDQYCRSCAHEF